MDALGSEAEFITPNLAGAHRCPFCGARHAERRTPKTYFERLDVKITGRRPYRCLDCGRRFPDHPYHRDHRDEPDAAEVATSAIAVGPAPVEMAPAAAAALDGETAAVPITVRRQRWVVDPGNTPLGPSEVYGLVLIGSIVAVLALVVVRVLWPDAPIGPRVID